MPLRLPFVEAVAKDAARWPDSEIISERWITKHNLACCCVPEKGHAGLSASSIQVGGSTTVTGERTRAKRKQKTYNTGDSLVVTDSTTSPAVTGLSRGGRTGSRAFQYLWSVVCGMW